MKDLIWNITPISTIQEALIISKDTALEDAFLLLDKHPPTSSDPHTYQVGLSTINAAITWIPTDKSSWDAWTGLRKLDNADYHGPVTLSTGQPYTGKRECACPTCNAHTLPIHRHN